MSKISVIMIIEAHVLSVTAFWIRALH